MASSGSNPLRLVLLGKTGVGKSAAGNTILGEKLFTSAARATSVTKQCASETKTINGQRVTVIDTPGLYDTNMSADVIEKETVRGARMAAPGPHAFVLVLSVTRHTEEERKTVKRFQEMFGDDVSNHMIVLFTHGDDLDYDGKTVEDFIREAGDELQNLINACKQRYQLFNNRSNDSTQADQFLQKINRMLEENGHSYYNYELFTIAEELKKEKENKREMEQKMEKLTNELAIQAHRSVCVIL